MNALIVVLRLVHIVGAVLWAGGVVVVARFILPAVTAAGPSGAAVMKELIQVRKMPVVLLGLGVATVVGGIGLFIIDWRNSLGAFTHTTFGIMIQIGATLGIAAVLIGAFVSKPAADRLGKIGATVAGRGGAPTADEAAQVKQLQGRLATAAQAVAVLVVLAAACMAVARYL